MDEHAGSAARVAAARRWLAPLVATVAAVGVVLPWVGFQVPGLTIKLTALELLRLTSRSHHNLVAGRLVSASQVALMAVPLAVVGLALCGSMRRWVGLAAAFLAGLLGLASAVFTAVRIRGGGFEWPASLQYGYFLFAGAVAVLLLVALVELYQVSERK